jgi:Mor family transcriptional regulator
MQKEVKMEDLKFSNDMQMLSEIIGKELTIKVIAHMSGINIYIPKPDYQVIQYYHDQLGSNVKKTAQHLGVSERMVYRAIAAKDNEERQLNLFDESTNTNKIKKYGKQHNRGCLQPQ